MKLSIIIPVLNEAGVLASNLKALQWVRHLGHEIIVVDGGSHDQSETLAKPLADQVISSSAGRAMQMNAGENVAINDILLFLHVDTLLPKDAVNVVVESIERQKSGWGRFDVCLSGRHAFFRIIAFMMNFRSRITGIATGDQAIFISRDLFEKVGGFPEIPLMEDVELSRQLKKVCTPICLTQKVITSSRRWEQGGIFKTIRLMWRLRFAYWRGVDPAALARQYRS